MTLAEEIAASAHKIKFEDIPAPTVQRAKLFLMDTLGVALAGRTAEGVSSVIELVAELGGRPEANVLGANLKAPAPLAALANSLMAHARDFDDLHEAGGAHVNITVVPAALAVAQRKGVSGKKLLTAIINGVDLVCRLGVSVPIFRGWHISATYGIFGSALAAGLLLDLPEPVLVNALGIACSQAAGTRQARLEGTLAKRLQPALACQSGVMAALMAEKGLTGPREFIEGMWGLARVYSDDHESISRKSVEKFRKGLGRTFMGDELSFKLYPCCKVTHTSIEAALDLARINCISPDEVEEVTVRVSQGAYNTVGQPFAVRTNPQVDAQFSIAYTVALALLQGKVGLTGFEVETICRPRLQEMALKVRVEIDPDLKDTSANMVNLAAKVAIHTNRGVFHKELTLCKGHPENPPHDEEIHEKFRDCARYNGLLADSSIEGILDTVKNLESLADVNDLLTSFTDKAL